MSETEVIDAVAFEPGDLVKFAPNEAWLEQNLLRGKNFVSLVIGMNQGQPILRVFNPYATTKTPITRGGGALKVGTPTGFSFSYEPGQRIGSNLDVTVWFDGSQGTISGIHP